MRVLLSTCLSECGAVVSAVDVELWP